MKITLYFLFSIGVITAPGNIIAQAYHDVTIPFNEKHDSSKNKNIRVWNYQQLDLIDIGLGSMNKTALRKPDTTTKKSGRLFASPIPGVGYSLQTGFEGSVISNLAFYTTNSKDANISSIAASLNYTQYHQFLFPVQANLWTKSNAYNIQTDWRYVKFPQTTYGLGGYTKLSDGYRIDFSNLRFHTIAFRSFSHDVYIGLGYNFDYYRGMREINPPKGTVTDYEKYGITPTAHVSGISLSFQYDTRRNSINPEEGNFVNLIYTPDFTLLGSSANWQTLVLDMRKFIKIPNSSQNVLAFWSYNWLTFGEGKAPYVALPNTGGDPYSNTGRGYIEGRFRGRNMLYLESEYRFGILKDGLLGGVVFTNVETFSEEATNKFEIFYPGYGVGIRIKFNKYSRTNVAIDYALGIDGSKGFFLNLGEVF